MTVLCIAARSLVNVYARLRPLQLVSRAAAEGFRMGAVAATVASSLCLSSLAQVEQHDSLNHEDRDLALAEFVQRVARIPQLNLHASWTVRTRFAEPARRADGPAERVGVLEFVGRAGEFWASFTDDSADGAGGHAPVEIAWFGGAKLAFVHQGRGETGTVSISSTPALSGPFEDIPLLAQFVPGVAGLPLPRIADVLALTPSDAISRIDGQQYVWTLPNVWGAPGLVPTTLTFCDSPTPRLTRLVCRVPVPAEPLTSFPEACGGEASVLVWKDVHGSSVAQSAERANFAWFPGRVSPDAQRTQYELNEANRSSSRPSEFLRPAQWLVDGAGVSDLRIGAFGTIGDARLVIAGTPLRLRRALAVEDVLSGQLLSSLCEGVDSSQVAQEVPSGSMQPRIESGAAVSRGLVASAEPEPQLVRFVVTVALAAIGGWIIAIAWRRRRLGIGFPVDASASATSSAVPPRWIYLAYFGVCALATAGLIALRPSDLQSRSSTYVDLGDVVISGGSFRLHGAIPMNGRTDQDCRIEAVSASCGCVRVADVPRLIPKNESISIPITFDVTTEGEKRVDVVAVLDDGTTRHITLVARGVVDIAGLAPLAIAPQLLELGVGAESTIVCLIRDSSEDPNALRPPQIRWIAPEGVEFGEQQLRLIEPFTKGNSPVWESLTRVKATGTIATLRTAIARLDLDGVAAGQVQIVFAATEKEPR